VKQLILNLDENDRFIIADLDDNHVLISRESLERVKEALDAEVRSASTM
jgi:hypothetical protein